MIQYFQLTPEILLEYISLGDSDSNKKDVCGSDPIMLLKSDAFSSKYLFFKDDNPAKIDSFSNLVLPTNTMETQFVVAKSKYQNFFSPFNAHNRFMSKDMYAEVGVNYGENVQKCEVKYDKCIVHFTSRKFFENYDSLIFQAYIYMSDKTKFYLSSFLLEKSYDRTFKSENLLYNEKLYTTHIEFDIPSIASIIKNDNEVFNMALYNAIGSKMIMGDSDDSDFKLSDIILQNTPIGINIYGATNVSNDNYKTLKTSKINSIFIPYAYNRLDEIRVNITEASDGDYYIIDPEITGYKSFVDYINSMGENIRAYMVMHELCLLEYDENGVDEITHREHHIIDINDDDEDVEISRKFDAQIKYRPICMYSGEHCKAYIKDTIKVINIVDNSSYEVEGRAEVNRKKYGKKLSRINLAGTETVRPIINVYNKKVSEDNATLNGVGALGKGRGFVVENMSQNITSFIECTNIGVSIVELSPDDIN